MNKHKSHAFGKDCYLLGRYQDEPIWLEAASFDCGWYWGFGYIKVYTRQLNPANSRDVSSHSHWDGLLSKQDNGEHLHHINEAITDTVLTDAESWKLSDLMQSFYTLRSAAETLGLGGSNLSGSGNIDALKSDDIVKQINEVMLPSLFAEVYAILDPISDQKAA